VLEDEHLTHLQLGIRPAVIWAEARARYRGMFSQLMMQKVGSSMTKGCYPAVLGVLSPATTG
jgi:hypothetical protein